MTYPRPWNEQRVFVHVFSSYHVIPDRTRTNPANHEGEGIINGSPRSRQRKNEHEENHRRSPSKDIKNQNLDTATTRIGLMAVLKLNV